MSAPIVIVHGWSASSASVRDLGEFLSGNLGTAASVIDLADWLPLNDEVTYLDLRRAMDQAWDAHSDLAHAPEVNVVTHSTGALVVRDWMTWRFGQRSDCPIKHLLMLAPANFGSPLAHLGASFLGRNIRDAETGFKAGLQTGINILSGLELGSDFTWNLAMQDLFSADPWYGSSGILATVLVGNTGYTGVRSVVNQPGTDGTVRVSTANLNARKATLTFGPDGSVENYLVAPAVPAQRTAFGVLDGLNHSSITQPKSPESEHGSRILRALTVGEDEFEVWCATLDTATTQLYENASSANPYFHAYQNIVVRAYDDVGNAVGEYLVEFHEDQPSKEFSVRDFGFLFQHSIITNEHNFSGNNAFRCFLLDVTQIADLSAACSLNLKVDPHPRFSDDQQVGYLPVQSVPLNGDARGELFQPNGTLLLEVTFPRKLGERVFSLRPMG